MKVDGGWAGLLWKADHFMTEAGSLHQGELIPEFMRGTTDYTDFTDLRILLIDLDRLRKEISDSLIRWRSSVERPESKLQLARHSRTVNRELRTVIQWRPPSGFRKTFLPIGPRGCGDREKGQNHVGRRAETHTARRPFVMPLQRQSVE
jgi:hypothetical protein